MLMVDIAESVSQIGVKMVFLPVILASLLHCKQLLSYLADTHVPREPSLASCATKLMSGWSQGEYIYATHSILRCRDHSYIIYDLASNLGSLEAKL